MLEDSPSGVHAGAAAGLPVIALTCGGQPEAVLLEAGATMCVTDFRDVMALIHAQEAAAL